MSIINKNDNKPVENRKPLDENSESGLIDRTPKRLIDAVNKLNLGSVVNELWGKGTTDRSEWLNRQQDLLTGWDDFVDPRDTRTGPWADSSNIHLPVVLTAGKALHSRMYGALLGFDPPFSAMPRDEASTVAAPIVEAVMAYTLKEWINEWQGVEEIVDKWLWDWIFTGVGLLKVRWERKFKRYVDVVQEQRVDTKIVRITDEASGEEIDIPQQTTRTVEVEKPIEDKVFDGPMCERVLPEDLLIIGGDGDPQKADAVLHRYFATQSELYSLADQKIFSIEAVNKVLDSGKDSETGDQSDNIKQDREKNSGVQTLDVETDHDRFEIIEAYLSADVNNDGMDEDIVLWVHPKTREVLRATYLHRVHKGGMRPFVKIDFLKRQESTYGMGVAEVLDPLATEIDAMHNIRVDFGVLSTMPFGFYRPSAGMDAKQINLEPGKLIPVDNPSGDVFFPQMGNRAGFPAAEESSLLQFVERLISISDVNLGRIGGQGVTRTATGTSALVNENASNLDIFIKRMQRGWRQALRIIFQMLQHRMPEEMPIRITGSDGMGHLFKIKRTDIQFKFDFALEANSVNSNKAITQQKHQQIMQLVMNPLLIQLGIVSPINIYNAHKDFLRAADIKQFSSYITKPDGADEQISLLPEEELMRVAKGLKVPVVPRQDHARFIELAQDFVKDPKKLEQFNPNAAELIINQAKAHNSMLQALEAQAAQQRNIQQQQINTNNASEQEVGLDSGGATSASEAQSGEA